MEYLKAVSLLKEIESNYDVMSVKCKGVSVWPHLRIYLMSSMATHGEQNMSSNSVKLILKSLFFYNPLVFWKRYDLWNFNCCDARKLVRNKYIHRISGMIHQMQYKALLWELPIPGALHYSKNEITEKNVISLSWLVMLSRGFSYLFKGIYLKIDNEDVIRKVLKDYQINYDYRTYLGRLIWEKRVSDFFFFLGHAPRLLVVECAYTHMGLIWSAHRHNIPVVELQHGVLNAYHYGYNPTYHSPELYPDEICVYGDEEYKYFTNQSKQYADRVSITGLYMLECADKSFKNDIFSDYRGRYRKIVVVSGDGNSKLEDLLSSFIDLAAEKLPNVMFMYLPRKPETVLSFSSNNVKCCYGVNIYNYLKWCDVHCTIASTTCLEAHYFHKPTIFLNYEETSYRYYGDVLSEKSGGFYVNSAEGFYEVFNRIDHTIIEYKEIFAHNHTARLQKVLDHYLND